MAELECPYCGKTTPDVPPFGSYQCECGGCWTGDEDLEGNPAGDWSRDNGRESKSEDTAITCPYCGIGATIPVSATSYECKCGSVCDMTRLAPRVWSPPESKLRNSDRDQLDRFRTLTAALWPYIRHFGLCGADPQAVEIVTELGQLIGQTAGRMIESDQVAAVQQSTLRSVIECLESSPLTRSWVKSSRDKFIEELKEQLDDE